MIKLKPRDCATGAWHSAGRGDGGRVGGGGGGWAVPIPGEKVPNKEVQSGGD